MRRPLIAAALTLAAAGATLVTAGSASALADGTPVQFTVSGNGLSITQPTTLVNLGTATSSDVPVSLTGVLLGTTSVTDDRAVKLGWTDSVAGPSTSFVDGAGDTVADSAVGVYLNPTSIVTDAVSSLVGGGIDLPVSTAVSPATAVKLSSTAQTFVQMVNVLGSSTSSFSTYANVTVPQTAVAGTYTGTITQTVA